MRHLWTRFAVVVAVAGTAAPASAFYWVGWPGANPVTPPIVTVVDPIPERPKPGDPDPVVDPPGEPGDPKGVPEPRTLALAAVGAGALAVRWWKKRKQK